MKYDFEVVKFDIADIVTASGEVACDPTIPPEIPGGNMQSTCNSGYQQIT